MGVLVFWLAFLVLMLAFTRSVRAQAALTRVLTAPDPSTDSSRPSLEGAERLECKSTPLKRSQA